VAVLWDAQPHLPTEINAAIWAALRKLEQAQYDSSAKYSADQAILGALGYLEKLNYSDSY